MTVTIAKRDRATKVPIATDIPRGDWRAGRRLLGSDAFRALSFAVWSNENIQHIVDCPWQFLVIGGRHVRNLARNRR